MVTLGSFLKKPALLLTLLLSSFYALTLFAQPVYVDDNANVITKDTEAAIIQALAQTENDEKFHVQAVILPNFYNKDPSKVQSAYYQHMLQSSKGDKAALLLIVLDKEYVQVITTPNIVGIFDAAAVRNIKSKVMALMREKQYDHMLNVGVSEILNVYKGKVSTARSKNSITDLSNILALIIGVAFLIYLYKRKKQASNTH
jgi:uncharacterized membrane protein YgcG